mmetsp:Transcript_38371/g.69140  ORF Transcript_38371/g.69140 Transcript_38371/m.69140 type:complete len:286 (+) Transcript_38371:379-1236(+)
MDGTAHGPKVAVAALALLAVLASLGRVAAAERVARAVAEARVARAATATLPAAQAVVAVTMCMMAGTEAPTVTGATRRLITITANGDLLLLLLVGAAPVALLAAAAANPESLVVVANRASLEEAREARVATAPLQAPALAPVWMAGRDLPAGMEIGLLNMTIIILHGALTAGVRKIMAMDIGTGPQNHGNQAHPPPLPHPAPIQENRARVAAVNRERARAPREATVPALLLPHPLPHPLPMDITTITHMNTKVQAAKQPYGPAHPRRHPTVLLPGYAPHPTITAD